MAYAKWTVHGEGIEPPNCPNTFCHRPETSILSGFPGNSQISDCPGWFWMLSLLLSQGLPSSDDMSTPLHPRAFAVVARQGKSGALSRHFIELLGQAGIREKQAHRSRGIGRSVQRQAGALSFHSLRRTATTLPHEAGVPAAVVQSLIGRDSEEVHQLYVAVGKDALASAAAKLPDLA